MKVLKLDTSSIWDDFVTSSINGTIFHSLRFLGYHPKGRFDFVNLAIAEGDDLVCVVPGGTIRGSDGARFRSPVGASFGGFVFRDLNLKRIYEIVLSVNSWLSSNGFRGVDLILPPPCYWKQWDEGLEFALKSIGYRMVSMDATCVVDLSALERSDLKPALQRNLRRSQSSGISVRRAQDVHGFYEILRCSLAAKHTGPTHSLDEIERLMHLFPDEIVLQEALLEDQTVGGCLIFRCNAMAALAFYICDDPAYRHLRVTDRLLYESAVWLRQLGHRYFDLGTVSLNAEINWGLLRFKSKLAGLIHARRYYSMEFGD